jgi:hypothetical protein
MLNRLTWEGEAPAEPSWVKHLRQGGSPGGTPSQFSSHLAFQEGIPRLKFDKARAMHSDIG